MSEPRIVSRQAQDYLKTIYLLAEHGGSAAARDIAREVGVAPATVTSMLKKLSRLELITYSPYRSVEMTPQGRLAALEVIRHHRLLELFLNKVLGYGLAGVHAEAEKLEHTISEQFEARMAEVLGDPRIDPHGSTIPGRDGRMEERRHSPLSEARPGASLAVSQLLARSSEALGYLEELGLLPQAHVRILEKRPLNGPLTIRIGPKRRETIGYDLARLIMVREHEG